jgi:hypothetical protein
MVIHAEQFFAIGQANRNSIMEPLTDETIANNFTILLCMLITCKITKANHFQLRILSPYAVALLQGTICFVMSETQISGLKNTDSVSYQNQLL